MNYRTNRKTGDNISEIGIGSSYMYEAGMEEAVPENTVVGGVPATEF